MSKRKNTENRAFHDEWEIKYFFIQNSDGKPQCVLCKNSLSNNKSSNLARHFSSLHEKTYGNYSDDKRRAIVDEIKKEIQVSMPASLQKMSLTASYAVCLKLAKAQKCFSDGTLIKECAIEMAKAFGHDYAVEHFATVALSQQTVRSRISNMSDSIKEKIKNLVARCRYYSLCMDESTDRTDMSQLLIFIRIAMEDFSEYEELLAVVSLHRTTGQDIFKVVKECVEEIGGFQKCSAIATDGAPAMVGRENGFVGHLKKNGINCLTFHCIIHQESLCGKSVRMLSAMKDVTKITNLIRGGNRSLSHRKWKTFLEEVDAKYGDLLLHSEIRWLSAGQCLVRFFALRKELAEFLSKEVKSDTTEFVRKLQDPSFLSELAFLTDFTNHLNNLNLNLQGKGRTISDMLANINGFRSKLTLFKCQLDNENLCHFPSCSELKKEFKDIKFSGFTSIISEVSEQFNRRFQDFKAIEADLIFYNNPMKANVQCVKSDLQEEVCNLQNDPFMLSRIETDSDIFKVMPQDRYPKLIDFALYVKSLFASTYICESTFSIMKHIKSAQRCSLTNELLEHQLRLATTQIDIDIEELISNTKRINPSH